MLQAHIGYLYGLLDFIQLIVYYTWIALFGITIVFWFFRRPKI